MAKYTVYNYLLLHQGENNTVKLLSEKLNLAEYQIRNQLCQLEHMKLVKREEKRIADSHGIDRKNFVYSA